jgi:hypothetical protein
MRKRCPASQKKASVRGGVANTWPNAILGAAVFAVIENGVGLWLVADLNFPAQLVRVSCLCLFIAFTVSPRLANGILRTYTLLGVEFLPSGSVFFVPALLCYPCLLRLDPVLYKKYI